MILLFLVIMWPLSSEEIAIFVKIEIIEIHFVTCRI